jgi:hypothetical protein
MPQKTALLPKNSPAIERAHDLRKNLECLSEADRDLVMEFELLMENKRIPCANALSKDNAKKREDMENVRKLVWDAASANNFFLRCVTVGKAARDAILRAVGPDAASDVTPDMVLVAEYLSVAGWLSDASKATCLDYVQLVCEEIKGYMSEELRTALRL